MSEVLSELGLGEGLARSGLGAAGLGREVSAGEIEPVLASSKGAGHLLLRT